MKLHNLPEDKHLQHRLTQPLTRPCSLIPNVFPITDSSRTCFIVLPIFVWLLPTMTVPCKKKEKIRITFCK